MHKKTKIIATVGPAIDDIAKIKELALQGIDIFRINLSHSNTNNALQWIKKLKKATENIKDVAIMIDTRGPEIRISKTKKEKIFLDKNSYIIIKKGNNLSDEKNIYINYEIHKYVKENTKVLLNDGQVIAKICEINKDYVKAKILKSGYIKTNKKFSIYKEKIYLPFITREDEEDIKACLKEDIDFIALSFCQDKESILKIKEIIKREKAQTLVIAKIENYQGLKNIKEILKIADAIMVARGDLGVHLPFEKIPIEQKQLIYKANIFAKPVITATEMLESMIENSHPTRAETTDIANAILDGSDAVMLSAETSVGKYPIEAVKTMKEIALNTEKYLSINNEKITKIRENIQSIEDTIGYTIYNITLDFNLSAIILINPTYNQLRNLAKYRIKVKTIVLSDNKKLLKFSNILWGINSQFTKSLDKENIINYLKHKKIIKNKDFVLINQNSNIEIKFIGDLLLTGISLNDGFANSKIVLITEKKDLNNLNDKIGAIIITKDITNEIESNILLYAKEKEIPLIKIKDTDIDIIKENINKLAVFNNKIYKI